LVIVLGFCEKPMFSITYGSDTKSVTPR